MGLDPDKCSEQDKSLSVASQLGKVPCWREFQEVNRAFGSMAFGRRQVVQEEVKGRWEELI